MSGRNNDCICGHPAFGHEHYRSGTDCSETDCRCNEYVATKRNPFRMVIRRVQLAGRRHVT